MQRQSQMVHHWELVDRLKQHLQTSLDVPASVMSIIADQIEQAISAPSELALKSLSTDLLSLVREVVRNSPKDAVDAVLDASAASLSTKAAHLLGQLGFAQLLAAQAASRRAGDDFFDTISSTRFRPYVELLLEGEMRNTDIAQRLEVEEETVSRALKVLRAEGITDFRRKGREVFNFLTPSASAVVGDLLEQTRARSRADQGENARVGLRRFAAVREATQETPRHFLRRQTLVPTETHETEGAL